MYITKTCLCEVHVQLRFFTAVKMIIIFAQNIDRGYTLEPPHSGGSNEYPRSMYKSKNEKNVCPCKPQFYYIKVGVRGYKTHERVNLISKVSKYTLFFEFSEYPS